MRLDHAGREIDCALQVVVVVLLGDDLDVRILGQGCLEAFDALLVVFCARAAQEDPHLAAVVHRLGQHLGQVGSILDIRLVTNEAGQRRVRTGRVKANHRYALCHSLLDERLVGCHIQARHKEHIWLLADRRFQALRLLHHIGRRRRIPVILHRDAALRQLGDGAIRTVLHILIPRMHKLRYVHKVEILLCFRRPSRGRRCIVCGGCRRCCRRTGAKQKRHNHCNSENYGQRSSSHMPFSS